jgi:DNA-binding SARP family transcriptional activator/tetratricopeptide (TPR) repeat protein
VTDNRPLTDRVEIRLLGGVDVGGKDDPPRVASPQLRRLLAALAVDAGRPVPVDVLIDRVWDEPRPAARRGLHVLISRLRRDMAAAGAPVAPILRRGGAYLLAIEPDRVDIYQFRALLARAREPEVADGERLTLLRRARALWRGSPLAGLSGLWVERTRLAWDEEHLDASTAWARAEVRAGDPGPVVAPLRELAGGHPLNEPLAAALMLALAAAGRAAEALDHFGTVRRGLAEELGADPGAELQAVYQALLRGDPDSTGEVVPAWPPPALLPPDIADFVGRGRLVAEVGAALLGPEPGPLRVVGIAGMGGIGKTALAVHVAHELADRYPDGQLYLNLQGGGPVPAPAEVPARLLRALGVADRAMPADLEERQQLYRSRLAGRRVLVVLDNAASEEQVRLLLPGTGGCAVLVTSRTHLIGVEGARWFHLDVFAEDEATGLLGMMSDRHRVDSEPAGAAEIVRLCGRLPLAVRIAGARLAARPGWPLARLATLLANQRQRLDVLAAGDLAVRSSLALSYAALDDDARRLFRGLGLFDLPDFPSWLSAAVLGVPVAEGEAAIERLVDAQLVADAGTSRAGYNRYRFHDLVRLYARERADREDGADRTAATLARGFGAYLGLAERMALAVPGPCYAPVHGSAPRTPVLGLADPADPLDWFDAERGALNAAVRQLCDAGQTDTAFDLAGCLEKYFDIRGMHLDWRHTNEYVMAAAEAAGDLRGQAVMLRGLIEVHTWHSADQAGRVMDNLYAEATGLAEMFAELGDQRGLADAMVQLAWALSARGEYAAAADRGEQSLSLAIEHDHPGGQARAHVALAVAYGESRQLERCGTHLTQALAAARRLGNVRYEATVLQFMGILHTRGGDLAVAESVLEASLAIVRGYHDKYAEALTLLTLARLHLRRDDPRARSSAEAALAIARAYTLPHHNADALGVLGEIELAEGRRELAVEYLTESVRRWRSRGWPSFLAEALTNLGRALVVGDPRAACAAWAEARNIYATLDRPDAAEAVDRLRDAAGCGEEHQPVAAPNS